jgi:hypothetical protein
MAAFFCAEEDKAKEIQSMDKIVFMFHLFGYKYSIERGFWKAQIGQIRAEKGQD